MMKKILLLLFLGLIIFGFLIYLNLPKVISFYLSRDFQIPTSIKNIQFKKNKIEIFDLIIENIKKINTKIALQANHISIHAPLTNLFKKNIVIEKIEFSNININLEYYDNSGFENNWAEIMATKTKNKKSSKTILIKTLVLNNINIILHDKNANITTYPTIDKLTLNNISSTEDFPADKIEKAIFNEMLKSIFQKLNLRNLLRSISPQNLIQKIPFVSQEEKETDSTF